MKLGIDVGSTTVKLVLLNENNETALNPVIVPDRRKPFPTTRRP